MQVILTQGGRYPNVWTLRNPDTDDIVAGPFIDRLTRNGAFAADNAVGAAITEGHDIVNIWVAPERGTGDTNMDAAEGALYRAAHGAFDG